MDILIEKIQERLQQQIVEHALASLQKPKADVEPRLAYGIACGFSQGMQHALDTVLAILREDEENERERKRIKDPDRFD